MTHDTKSPKVLRRKSPPDVSEHDPPQKFSAIRPSASCIRLAAPPPHRHCLLVVDEVFVLAACSKRWRCVVLRALQQRHQLTTVVALPGWQRVASVAAPGHHQQAGRLLFDTQGKAHHQSSRRARIGRDRVQA